MRDIRELLDFFADLLSTYDRERIMAEVDAFVEHMETHPGVPLEEAEPDPEIDPHAKFGKNERASVYDQRHLLSRPARKWYTPSERTTVKRGICVHHTAVEGGFGIHRRTARVFENPSQTSLQTGHHVAWSEGRQELITYPDAGTSFVNAEIARLHALGARYRGAKVGGAHGKGQPYHAISGPNSTLYLNLPFDWVTWHGNGANSQFLGYAWDGNSLEEEPPTAEIIEDLCTLAELMRAEHHRCDELTVHSAWSNKPHDPGAQFIEEVLIPAAALIGASINLDFYRDRGRPISRTLSTA